MSCICLLDFSETDKIMNEYIDKHIDKTKDFVVVYSNDVCVGSNYDKVDDKYHDKINDKYDDIYDDIYS